MTQQETEKSITEKPNNINSQSMPLTQMAILLPWTIWLVVVSFVVYKFFNQTGYSILNTGIANSIGLKLSDIGLLGSIYTLSYSILTLLCGALLDRYGARRVLISGICLILIGTVIFGSASTWNHLVIGQLLMGMGGAFGYPCMAYTTRRWFSLHLFGFVFGLAQALGSVMTTIIQQVAGSYVLAYGWRHIMYVQSAVGCFILIAILIVVRDGGIRDYGNNIKMGVTPSWRSAFNAYKVVLGNKHTWQTSILSGLTFACLLGIGVVWGVKVLVFRGFDPTTASDINSMLWLGTGLGAPAIALSSKILCSYSKAAVTFTVGATCSIVVFVFFEDFSVTLFYCLFFMIGFFGGGATVVSYTVIAQVIDESSSGAAFAILTFASFITTAFVMPIPGYLYEAGIVESLSQSMLFYAGVFALTAMSLLCFRWPIKMSHQSG